MSTQVDYDLLLQRAWSAREKAYAPYSKFAVGAALLTASGELFSGCNIENISLGLTICAERAAAAAAIQGGQRKFAAIALAADTAAPLVPCGACRQFLAEFNPSLAIYSAARTGKQKAWSLSQLLPSPNDGILDRAR
jgi:cytidine deaminase